MKTSEANFNSADGTRLFERLTLPDEAPRAAVLIVHGYAEHSGRYAHVAEALAAEGAAVYAEDHIGHGHSDGERLSHGREALGRPAAGARQFARGQG